MKELVTIYDELDRPFVCWVEGSRVLEIIKAPEPLPETNSVPIWHVTETDARFGE